MKLIDDFRLIRKVMKEMEQAEKEAGPYIPVSPDRNENLAELVRLSEKRGSRFTVTGDTREFTITTKPDIIPFFFWGAFVFYVPVTSFIKGTMEPVEILIMTLLFIVLVVWYKYSPSTWDITVSSYSKQLLLVCNNPIAGFLKSDIIIPFDEFEEFSSKDIFSQLKGTNNLYTKVFIHHNGRKTPLIYLNRENPDEDNYRVFISNLKEFF